MSLYVCLSLSLIRLRARQGKSTPMTGRTAELTAQSGWLSSRMRGTAGTLQDMAAAVAQARKSVTLITQMFAAISRANR